MALICVLRGIVFNLRNLSRKIFLLIVGQIRGVKLSVRDILLVVGVKIVERKWRKVLDYGGLIWYNTLMDKIERIDIDACYNLDCRIGMEMMKARGLVADCIVTDPPYLISYKSNHRQDKEHRFCSCIEGDDDPQLIIDTVPLMYDCLKENSPIYLFSGSDKIDFFKQEVEKYFSIKNLIVWDKMNWTAGDLEAQYGKQYEFIIYANKGRAPFMTGGGVKRYSDIWRFPRVSSTEAIHQNQKPLDLLYRIIRQHTKEGDLILDPFAGSQSLRIACHKLKRHYVGFERDEEYFKKGNEWFNSVTSQMSIFDL